MQFALHFRMKVLWPEYTLLLGDQNLFDKKSINSVSQNCFEFQLGKMSPGKVMF